MITPTQYSKAKCQLQRICEEVHEEKIRGTKAAIKLIWEQFNDELGDLPMMEFGMIWHEVILGKDKQTAEADVKAAFEQTRLISMVPQGNA